jgi:hypothetical protein
VQTEQDRDRTANPLLVIEQILQIWTPALRKITGGKIEVWRPGADRQLGLTQGTNDKIQILNSSTKTKKFFQ